MAVNALDVAFASGFAVRVKGFQVHQNRNYKLMRGAMKTLVLGLVGAAIMAGALTMSITSTAEANAAAPAHVAAAADSASPDSPGVESNGTRMDYLFR